MRHLVYVLQPSRHGTKYCFSLLQEWNYFPCLKFSKCHCFAPASRRGTSIHVMDRVRKETAVCLRWLFILYQLLHEESRTLNKIAGACVWKRWGAKLTRSRFETCWWCNFLSPWKNAGDRGRPARPYLLSKVLVWSRSGFGGRSRAASWRCCSRKGVWVMLQVGHQAGRWWVGL